MRVYSEGVCKKCINRKICKYVGDFQERALDVEVQSDDVFKLACTEFIEEPVDEAVEAYRFNFKRYSSGDIIEVNHKYCLILEHIQRYGFITVSQVCDLLNISWYIGLEQEIGWESYDDFRILYDVEDGVYYIAMLQPGSLVGVS